MREKVEYLEAKFNMEDEQARREKEEKKNERIERQARRESALAPTPLVVRAAEQAPKADDPLAPLYEKYARWIFEKADSPRESQLRLVTALAEIRKEAPLTHPSDVKMATAIQSLLVGMRATKEREAREQEATQQDANALRTVDSMTGKEINMTKLKTFGDVVVDDDAFDDAAPRGVES